MIYLCRGIRTHAYCGRSHKRDLDTIAVPLMERFGMGRGYIRRIGNRGSSHTALSLTIYTSCTIAIFAPVSVRSTYSQGLARTISKTALKKAECIQVKATRARNSLRIKSAKLELDWLPVKASGQLLDLSAFITTPFGKSLMALNGSSRYKIPLPLSSYIARAFKP